MPNWTISKPLILVAGLVAGLVALAVYIMDKSLPDRDPEMNASYKFMKKESTASFPFPEELTAEFRRNNNNTWVGNGPISDKDLNRLLSKEQDVHSISMKQAAVTPQGLALLESRRVNTLSFEGNEVSPQFMDALSRLNGLKSLSLADQSVDDKVVCHLTGPPTLRSLRLKSSTITTVGLRHIVKTFPLLFQLDLNHSRQLTDNDVSEILKLERLSVLNLSDTAVSAKGVAYLLKKSRLDDLSLGNLNITDAFLKTIDPERMTGLDLRSNPITDEGVKSLAKMHRLKSLFLMDCPRISMKGVQWLSEQLPGCRITSKHARESSLGTSADD